MKYLERLEKTQNEIVERMKSFIFEKNNEETKKEILKEITNCFKKNDIIEKDTLEEAGWEVSFHESGGRFNNIGVSLKTTIELTFYYKGGEI